MEVLYSSRAIIISTRGSRFLVVSDLHIGFEEKFRGAGISIESNVGSMAQELGSLISDNAITNLIIIGDVKSSTDRISRAEWENVPKLFSRIPDNCHVSIVPGNHDGGLDHLVPKGNVQIEDINGIMIDQNLLMHGHTRPLAKFSKECKRLIIGHLHPIYQARGSPLSGQPLWLFLKINRKKIFEDILDSEPESHEAPAFLEVIVMPSFNKDLTVAGYAREAGRNERKSAPILKALRGAEEAIIFTVNGEIIADESGLSSIL